MDIWVVSLAVVNSAATSISVQVSVQGPAFTAFGRNRGGLAGSCDILHLAL